MVPLDVKITGVIFQIFLTNSRRRARSFFDTLYILYKNTKIAKKWSNMVNSNFEWFESMKVLKISNFLLHLLISDQNWGFPKDIKIVEKTAKHNFFAILISFGNLRFLSEMSKLSKKLIILSAFIHSNHSKWKFTIIDHFSAIFVFFVKNWKTRFWYPWKIFDFGLKWANATKSY